MIWIALLLAQGAISPQINRGEALFFDAAQGCATCHAMKGHGTAVGPDLRNLGRLPPQAIVSAIRATVTAYVKTATLKDKSKFSAMPVSEDAESIQVYDLSKIPPELRKLAKSEVSIGNHDGSWKHPPAAAKYTKEQLADLVGYIRYAASGSRKVVEASEVE